MALLIAVCGAAFRFGGSPERVVATLFITASAASVMSYRAAGVRYHTLEVSVLVIDSALMVALVVVALCSDRFWPIWLSSIQLTTLFGHLTKAMYPTLLAHPYQIVIVVQSYLALLVLAVGTFRHARRTSGKPAPAR